MTVDVSLCQLGQAVIETEASAISDLNARIDENFAKACQILLACKARIVVIGMGKSGHIAGKIAATLASTGSPAFFVHPGEAQHGDMGMITANDVVLALSNSGKSEEIINLIPFIKRLHIPLISLVGDIASPLAQASDVALDVGVHQEACPLGLAPTASTTASLVMGDALAIALLQTRGFTVDDFARTHPGGTLGRRLFIRVEDLMHAGDTLPTVTLDTLLSDALIEMTEKALGMTCILDKQGCLAGVFTDGDLRRSLKLNIDVHQTTMSELLGNSQRLDTTKTINANDLAVDALSLMETHKITSLVIIDNANKPKGVIHMHDLLQAGVV